MLVATFVERNCGGTHYSVPSASLCSVLFTAALMGIAQNTPNRRLHSLPRPGLNSPGFPTLLTTFSTFSQHFERLARHLASRPQESEVLSRHF